ncbi:MAG TPA: hypothetical protein VMV18_09970 [bacterium]|nr:hypothetical protein [bacterium]
MLRRARCWVCGAVFEAERGSLPRGARFACARCAEDDLGAPGVDRAHLSRALTERYEVPFADVREAEVDVDVLRLLAEDFSRLHALLPLLREESRTKIGPETLLVAIADPGNVFALEHVRRQTGLRVRTCVAPWAELMEAIDELYLPLALAEDAPEGE